jgi:PKHD-type hydroxylase
LALEAHRLALKPSLIPRARGDAMIGAIFRLLDGDSVARIVAGLQTGCFVDGATTARGIAAGVKHNLQLERMSPEAGDLDQIVIRALENHTALQDYAMPSRIVMPVFSRYEPGMGYGDHIDNSMMGGYSGVRTDLAVTIFLSPPASYDGGELVIAGQEEIKLDSGEAYVYPATSIHHVAPVTRGVRLAAITWLQSAVRDAALRTILYDLSCAASRAQTLGDRGFSIQLMKVYHNLFRYAAEP